jgi:DNA polymerase
VSGVFYWDTETRGRFKLNVKHGGVGSERYLRDEFTQILLIVWALDNGPVQHWRWGDAIAPLLADVQAAERFAVHNINFDHPAWHLHMVPLGLPPIPIEQCDDTSVWCRALGLLASLEGAAKILLPPKFHKAGKAAVFRMSKPRHPWKGEDPNVLHWVDDPESWAELIPYAKQDVEVLRALYQLLAPLSLTTANERLVQLCDFKINQRGVYLDGVAIAKACELIAIARQVANTKIRQLTSGTVASTDSLQQVQKWLKAQGCNVPNLKAATLLEALQRDDLTSEARAVIEQRLEAAQAAAAKPIRMRAWRCEDGRARHTLIYHGATTGRWSGTGVQFQNVKKEGDEIADKFAAILGSDQEDDPS